MLEQDEDYEGGRIAHCGPILGCGVCSEHLGSAMHAALVLFSCAFMGTSRPLHWVVVSVFCLVAEDSFLQLFLGV